MKAIFRGLWITLLLVGTILTTSVITESPVVNAVQMSVAQKDYVSHPYQENIEYVLKNKLMWVFGDGNFRPSQKTTQADLVVSLSNVKGLVSGVPVQGLPANHWAMVYYERAKKNGILANVQIDPNKVLTREEASHLMVNAWESLRKTRTQKESGPLKPYPYSQISVSYQWLPKKTGKFVNGVSTTLYDGISNVTRAEQAFALSTLHRDYLGIQEGEKIAIRIHNSLKVTNGILKGQIPTVPGYSIRLFVRFNNGSTTESKSGGLSVSTSQIKYLQLSVKRAGEAVPLALYNYLKLSSSSLERENVR